MEQTPRIICFVVSRPNELHPLTLSQITNQTTPITRLILLNKIYPQKDVPTRISAILNDAIEALDEPLQNYDYILRVDGDTLIPTNFIEKNLKNNPDIVGYGQAQLIKTSTFKEVMNNRFFEYQDDTYIVFKFRMHNKKIYDYRSAPLMMRPNGAAYTYRYFINRGETRYCLGYEPLHIIGNTLRNKQMSFQLIGYLKAWLTRKPLWDTAKFVRIYQITKLFGQIKKYFTVT